MEVKDTYENVTILEWENVVQEKNKINKMKTQNVLGLSRYKKHENQNSKFVSEK